MFFFLSNSELTSRMSKLNLTDPIVQPFQIKSKEKWKFKKTYHTVDTCIDLAENEIIDWKNGENE